MEDDQPPAEDASPEAPSPPRANRPRKPKASASDSAPPKPSDLEKAKQNQHVRDLEVATTNSKLDNVAKDSDVRRRIELLMGRGIFIAMAAGLAIPFLPPGDGQKIAGGIVGAVVSGCLGYLAGRGGGGKA